MVRNTFLLSIRKEILQRVNQNGKVFAGTYSQERFERGLQRMCAYD
nr:MAG TPA: hypothetical protein [Caudoviricetes sp.]